MNTPFINNLRKQIQSLYSFAFQEFITKLFLLRYGAENYIVTREIKDNGVDGIIKNEETIVACYGPEKIDKNNYIKKINNDFKLYTDY